VLEVRPGALRCDGREVPASEVEGFEERYDPWGRRALLVVRGPDHVEPIEPGYSGLRKALRRAFPDRPFISEWDDGRFPPGWFARRGWLLRSVGLALFALAFAAMSGAFGQLAGGVVAVAVAWALLQGVGRVTVSRRGIAAGLPWEPVRPWHLVDEVSAEVFGPVAQVEVHGRFGAMRATVPAVILPAFRARVRRLGGLQVVAHGDAADRAYRMLRPVAVGAAWGLAVGGLGAALRHPHPWVALTAAAWLATVGALAACAVEARSLGWSFGAVVSLTLLYGVALVTLSWWWL